MKQKTPERIIRDVVELCANCDTCRMLMEEDCVFFPELYRLWDREVDEDIPISDAELRNLMELCTLCGVCPCPNIPADLMAAKSHFIAKEGLPPSLRLLTDVPRLGRLCGTFPRLIRLLQQNAFTSPVLRAAVGVHPDRELPSFAEESFFRWAEKRGLSDGRDGERKVAYFAGCTAGYLFPDVGRALVRVLERNGVTVHVPPQECCGMPHLVEGERDTTLRQVQANMKSLLDCLESGHDVVCSCPTCGFLMKVLLKERAYFSDDYQRTVAAGEDEIRIPDPIQGGKKQLVLRKSSYSRILKDDGYFSSLPALSRIAVAEQVNDAGDYLARLHAAGELDTGFISIPERMVYFAPCHQRGQKVGSPYLELMGLIPGLKVERVGGMDCCGMGGNFGFKKAFHQRSLEIGQQLMEKIRQKKPAAIITDCLSCRLQFRHVLPYPVLHPIEVLAGAYGKAGAEAS